MTVSRTCSRVRWGYVCFILGLYSVFPFTEAHALTRFFTDFDNTLIETRKIFGGTFKTSFRLFRISLRNNTLQNIPQGPEYIDISPQDYLRLVTPENRTLLAQGEGRPGAVGVMFTLQDGTTFEPANYMVVNPQTFQTFLPMQTQGTEGYLVNDFKTALNEGKSFRGETWPLMQLKLASQETVEEFGILSARGHTDEEWLQAFGLLLNNKDKDLKISHMPDSRNLHGISREDYTLLTTSAGITQRKVAFFKQLLLNISRRGRLTEADRTLNANGTATEQVHTIIMAEDDQKTLDAIIEVFQAFAMRSPVPFKLVFWNTGFHEEIASRKRPKIGVVKSDGTFRTALIGDLVGPLSRLSEEQKTYLPQIEKLLKMNGSFVSCAEQLSAHVSNKK